MKPDGDAIGSQIGFREALRVSYPRKQIYAVGDSSDRYGFIGELDTVADEVYTNALVLVVDTPEETMISDQRYKNGDYIIKIDHHIPRSEFGNSQIVDPSFESCSGLIADMIFRMGLKLTDHAARALFSGIVTDSGRFRFDSVTSRTFEITAKLLKYNFCINEVYSNLYLEDLKTVTIRAKFILNIKLTQNMVAYMKTTAEDLLKYDTDLYTISRGMVNAMRGIRGIDIWVNFTEDRTNNSVIAEIRSSKYNINTIAAKYGGGGHQLASGATLKSFEEADMMLKDLDQLIKDEQDGNRRN
jgi:phosphoesterase RecJ-like protein